MFKSLVACHLIGILLIISIRQDGYFPFPKSWPEERLLFIVLLHTIALSILVLRSSYLLISDRARDSDYALPPRMVTFIQILLAPLLITGILALHYLQSKYFANVGYRSDLRVLLMIGFASLIPIGGYWAFVQFKKKRDPFIYLGCILASSTILKMIPLQLFPITAARSDLLPILKEAAQTLVQGENPYRYYLLENGVRTQTVRLPGLILAYLPPVLLKIDLRFTNLFFECIIFLLLFLQLKRIFWTKDSGWREQVWVPVFVLTNFILLPYWHYRHELYEVPFWLAVLLTLYAFEKKSSFLFCSALIVLCCMHQWGWLFTAFLLLAWLQTKGIRSAVLCGVVTMVVSFCVLLYVTKGDLGTFYEHVFAHYNRLIQQAHFYPMSMYLAPFFSSPELRHWLKVAQLACQVPLLLYSIKRTLTVAQLTAILSLSLFFMLLFNAATWTYQLLLVFFLLYLALIFHYDEKLNPKALR